MYRDREYRLSAPMNDGIIEIILSAAVTRNNVSRLQKEIDSLRHDKGNRLPIGVRTLHDGSGVMSCFCFFHWMAKHKKAGRPSGCPALQGFILIYFTSQRTENLSDENLFL